MTPMRREFAPFRKVLAPVLPGCDPEAALAAALRVAEAQHIVLLGLVVMPPDEPLAFGMLAAREVRAGLQRLSTAHASRVRVRVRVTHAAWPEIVDAVHQEQADLMIISHPLDSEPCSEELLDGLAHPPCDVALIYGDVLTAQVSRVLVPVRGGPHAELSVRLALAVAESSGAEVTALHVPSPAGEKDGDRRSEIAYRGLASVLSNLPGVTLRETETDDPAGAVLAASHDADLVVMGSPARLSGSSLGAIADHLLQANPTSVMIARTRRPVPAEAADPAMAEGAIALLVDKWLAESTYDADEFADVEKLLALKAQRGLSISLAVPALNEEATIGKILRVIKSALYDKAPLLDEIMVVDGGSTDRTRELAAFLGVPVYTQQEILPQYGALKGKGEALWKSLHLPSGDLVVWLDGQLTNVHPRFVCGLLGPLLSDSRIQYVKGFGRRPSDADDEVQVDSRRAADLAVRPFLNLVYPDLSGVLPLLSGQCAGRRTALEQLPFPTGLGVHPALLLEIYEHFGLSAIAQVDLQEHLPERRSLESLTETTYAVLQVFLRKLERRHGLALVEDINRTMKLVRGDADRLYVELREVREPVRPPIIDIPEYAARRSGSEDAAWI